MKRLSILLFPLVLIACNPANSNSAVESEAPPSEPETLVNNIAQADTTDYPMVHVYKNPGCMCCDAWADHLREDGFDVEVTEHAELSAFKAEHGISQELASCHTAVVGDYVVEGHVPAGDIKRMLDETPDAVGIAVPGMPVGSPGMEVAGRPGDPYDVLLVAEDRSTSVYAHHAAASSE